MPADLAQLLAIGAVKVAAYGAAAATAAYALFRFLGSKWIEHKFAESLEKFKHDQAVVVARLRVEIESMLSGALKLQELEFSVLPEAWKRLDMAFGRACYITASLQQYTAIAGLTPTELDEALEASKISESQRVKIRAAKGTDQEKLYHDLIYWQRVNLARRSQADLEEYVASNGLFLPPALKKQFNEVIPIIRHAILAAETGKQFDEHKMRGQAAAELAEKAAPIKDAIENAIEERLHSHARAPDKAGGKG